MNEKWQRLMLAVFLLLALGIPAAQGASSTNFLTWDKSKDRVDADVQDWELWTLLEHIAGETGWHIFVEPGLPYKPSVKFKQRPSGEALRMLLGNLNFALVPQTNNPSVLYVFRTARDRATQFIRGPLVKGRVAQAKRVPNELIVRVKPGVDIEKLAAELGAKVVGKIPEMDAYRLQFENDEATELAKAKLAANPEVAAVEYNYYVDQPPSPFPVAGASAPQTLLTLDPPKQDGCKVVIGLVDTAVQPMTPQLEQFIKQRASVAGDSNTETDTPLHGTSMVATLVQGMQAANRSSTSTSVPIISVDAFGKDPMANTFNVANGMIKAANLGATVINSSLGGYADSQLLRDAVTQLANKNIPVFAAVGNDASSSQFFPAAYPQVISVTAVDRGQLAPYANTGTTPDIGAPGTVLFPFNNQTYVSQGTSVSTAVATGVAARLADANCAPWSQVIPALEKSMPVPSGH
jgi:hypothetical protein